MIQPQAARKPLLRQEASLVQDQFVDFSRIQVHD
jgi:hypothetical protein